MKNTDVLLLKHLCRPVYLDYNVTTSNFGNNNDSNSSTRSGGMLHTMMHLSMRDNSTGQAIRYVTFYIVINDRSYENNSSISSDNTSIITNNNNRSIMHEFFEAVNGTLILDFIHSQDGDHDNADNEAANTSTDGISASYAISGDHDPFTNAWIPSADSKGIITITNFPFMRNETYDMDIKILTMELPGPKGLLNENELPRADFVFNADNNENTTSGKIGMPVPVIGKDVNDIGNAQNTIVNHKAVSENGTPIGGLNPIDKMVYLIGIGTAIAGVVAFLTLRRIK